MDRRKKVKPEECPGHRWIVVNTVKVCWHCTIVIPLTEGLSPEDLKEERASRERAKRTKKQWAAKKAAKIAASIPDLAKLPDGIAGLLPKGSGDIRQYSKEEHDRSKN